VVSAASHDRPTVASRSSTCFGFGCLWVPLILASLVVVAAVIFFLSVFACSSSLEDNTVVEKADGKDLP